MSGAPQRPCLFCDKPAGSKEHALPRWLQEFANPTLAPAEIVRRTGSHRASGHNNFITKSICDECNTVWLAGEFEGPGAPLIRTMWETLDDSTAAPLALSADEQAFVSAWAYKTTLLLTACMDGGTEVAKGEFERFREASLPPVESVVRLASSDFPTLALTTVKIRADKGADQTAPVMTDAGAAGFVALLLIGPMVFWIVRAPVEYLAENHFHPPFPTTWPAQLCPTWPTEPRLDKPELEALVKHLNARPDFGDEPLRT